MSSIDMSYYKDKYGNPKSEQEAIRILCEAYTKLIENPLTMASREGIGEYYRILTSRELPAFEWMLDAFHMVNKKEPDKRNFPYIVGMLRQWMKHGYGHIPSQEEEDLVDYIEEEIRVSVSYNARKTLKQLMGHYGSIKIARMIPKVKETHDISEYFLQCLKQTLEQRFQLQQEIHTDEE